MRLSTDWELFARGRPDIKVATWGIADLPPGTVTATRERSGIDGALVVSAVRPDLYVIQTDWHDWSNLELPAEYPLKYKPFVEAIRATGCTVPILLQADIGSWKNCRRGTEWMLTCAEPAGTCCI